MNKPSDAAATAAPMHPQTQIGHVHLKVADLERAIAFYHGVLGFEVTQRWGDQAAFLLRITPSPSGRATVFGVKWQM